MSSYRITTVITSKLQKCYRNGACENERRAKNSLRSANQFYKTLINNFAFASKTKRFIFNTLITKRCVEIFNYYNQNHQHTPLCLIFHSSNNIVLERKQGISQQKGIFGERRQKLRKQKKKMGKCLHTSTFFLHLCIYFFSAPFSKTF